MMMTSNNKDMIDEENDASLSGGVVEAVEEADETLTHHNEDVGKKKVESLVLAKKEDRWVFRLRILATLVLLGVALAVCLGVYLQGRSGEKEAFEDGFSHLAEKLVTSFQGVVKQRVGVVESFASSITSYVNSNDNVSWPFVTIPDFERRVTEVSNLASLGFVNFAPRVADGQRKEWSQYSMINGGWKVEGLAIQMGVTPESIKDSVSPVSPVIFYINMTDDGTIKAFPSNGQKDYFPLWMQGPAVNNSAANVDYYHHHPEKGLGESIESVLETRKPALMNIFHFWKFPEEKLPPNYHTIKARKNIDYQGDPGTSLIYPIFDTLDPNEQANRQPVGILKAMVYWRTYFDSLLPPGANGIVVVLENSCGQNFTYQVDGTEARPIDEGDHHDTKYDYLETSTAIEEIVDLCQYSIRVYPSQELEDSYYTNGPAIASIVLALMFLFTSGVFLLYDWMVARRQGVVMKSALQSGQLVSDLFPKAVRDQLYKEQEEAETLRKSAQNPTWESSKQKQHKLKESTTTTELQPLEIEHKAAIANLYPDTTIFFADLVGFTKWSSTRTPVEVFKLLEAIYSEFDKIADRRKVFKVETIGDCYVAVTGLPEAQEDHASRMCRFATDAMAKMNLVTASVASSLGEDTADLGMRVGLHSGPVTAGVLRGKKSRFQLFGDTVNTASRMESNGVRGRIHVSPSTAESLIQQGKGAWLTPREDKIVAKGKGEMQTYWVTVINTRASCTTMSTRSSVSDDDMKFLDSRSNDGNQEEPTQQLPEDHLNHESIVSVMSV